MTKIVVLDPGHGGKDPGASGNGLQEKNIVLQIAIATKNYLDKNYEGHKTVLTRTTDVFIELLDRSAKANTLGADLFVSIHINASASVTAKGFETFRYDKSTSTKTQQAQSELHNSIMKNAPFLTDRGRNSANFSVLRNTNMSAVLTESGFITNKTDASNLANDKNILALAKGHAEGIASFLNLQKKTVNSTKTIYKVVVGTYEDIKEATAIKNSLDKDFRNVTIIQEKE